MGTAAYLPMPGQEVEQRLAELVDAIVAQLLAGLGVTVRGWVRVDPIEAQLDPLR